MLLERDVLGAFFLWLVSGEKTTLFLKQRWFALFRIV